MYQWLFLKKSKARASLAEEEFSRSNQQLADAFPNKAKFIACIMVLPMSTANYEHTVPSSLWATRKPTSETEWSPRSLIYNLKGISMEGPIAMEFDFLRAINNEVAWDREKDESRLNFNPVHTSDQFYFSSIHL